MSLVSSAMRRLVTTLFQMLSVPPWAYSGSNINLPIEILETIGKEMHPCMTQTVALNKSSIYQLMVTIALSLV